MLARLVPGMLVLVGTALLLAWPLTRATAAPVLATTVGGAIHASTIWTLDGSPYVVAADVVVSPGTVLTIEPGVEVRFDAERRLQVDGTLIARGTAALPITFTSNRAARAPGDWAGIVLSESSPPTTLHPDGSYAAGSVLQYVVVEYAGARQDFNRPDAIGMATAVLVERSTVRHTAGRGIRAGQGAVLRQNTITGNVGVGGGAGILAGEDSLILGNTIADNTAFSSSGGGLVVGANSIVANNTISGNRARWGFPSMQASNQAAGAPPVGARTIGLYHCGGAIVGSGTTVTRNTIVGNTATDGSGGGLCGAANLNVAHNTITGNTASYGDGGGIRGCQGSIVVGNTITGNHAGRLPSSSTDGRGGGIFGCTDSSILDNVITGNTAWDGGGVYGGGGTLQRNLIAGNRADGSRGSGVAGFQGTIEANTIRDNQGRDTAGGVDVELGSHPMLRRNSLVGNVPYDLADHNPATTGTTLDATQNFWGTTNATTIAARIYDGADDPSLETISFLLFLSCAADDAPQGSTPGGTPSPTPSPLPTCAGGATPTPTPTRTPTPAATRTPTPTAPPTTGGSGFTLQRGAAVQLTWTGGSVESGYRLVRWSPEGGAVLLPPGGPLPAASRAYLDPAPPADQLVCYTLLVLGSNASPLAISDLLCSHPAASPGGAPGQFAIRLNQSSLVRLSWAPPGGQVGYLLVAFTFDGRDPRTIPLSDDETGTVDETGGTTTCYALVAMGPTAALGNTDALCAVPGASNGLAPGASSIR